LSVTKLEKLAAAALRHPHLRWIMKEVPARYADNGRVIASLLVAAATADPGLADNEAFATAHASLSQVNEARDLRDQVARLYHDPELRRLAGDRLDFYMANPADAYQKLLEVSASANSNRERQAIHDAMLAAQEAIDFQAEHGGGGAAPSTPQVTLPSDPGVAEAEYKKLIEKSISAKKLSLDEDARMHALALGIVTRRDAAEAVRIAAATAPKPEPGEYERLISESTERPLDAGEQGRLEELATDRAASAGLLEESA
jgi:hypothetical protein